MYGFDSCLTTLFVVAGGTLLIVMVGQVSRRHSESVLRSSRDIKALHHDLLRLSRQVEHLLTRGSAAPEAQPPREPSAEAEAPHPAAPPPPREARPADPVAGQPTVPAPVHEQAEVLARLLASHRERQPLSAAPESATGPGAAERPEPPEVEVVEAPEAV